MVRSSAATILASAGAAAVATTIALFVGQSAPGPQFDGDSSVEVAELRRQVVQLEGEVAALRTMATTPVEGAPEPVRTVEVEEGRPDDELAARCDELTAQCADLSARCEALEQRLTFAPDGASLATLFAARTQRAARPRTDLAALTLVYGANGIEQRRGQSAGVGEALPYLMAIRALGRAAQNGDAAEVPADAQDSAADDER